MAKYAASLQSALLLAVAIAPTDASAADMMMDAKVPREPAYRCDIIGFIELPSTDICFKIGGHARLDTSVVDGNWLGTNTYYVRNIAVDGYTASSSGVIPAVSAGYQNETVQTYASGRVNFDARSATEYGTVRAFVEVEADDDESRTGGSFELRHAFVQFDNWTFGKTWSTFLDRDARVRRADPFKVVGDSSESMRLNQIRYTQEFGGGVSFALAIEDQAYNSPTSAIVGIGPFVPLVNPAATSVSVVDDRSNVPNVVAALRWEREDIGSLQLSGVLHQNRFAEQQTISGVPVQSYSDDEFGYGVLVGLAFKVPTGTDDKYTLIAMYLDGASNYQEDLYGTNTEVVWGRCGLVNCILDQVTKASVVSSFTHYWTEAFSISFGAGYAETDFGALGTATTGSFGVPGILDVASFEGFANLQWDAPGKTTFLLDVHYGHIDYGGFDLNPTAPGIQDSEGAWVATLEITRQF